MQSELEEADQTTVTPTAPCFDDPVAAQGRGIRATKLVHEIREFPSLLSLLGAPGSHGYQEVLTRG